MSADALAALSGSWVMRLAVESWRAGELLADDVPVDAGALEIDRTLRVPERVTLSVPRLDRGTTWDPGGDPGHPLAAAGQRLRLSVGVELGNGVVEWVRRAWVTVHTARTIGDVVTVECVGLLGLVDEARFVAPFQPSGTFASTVRALVEPAITVEVSGALVDRAVPAALSWDEDRLAALHELLDAWPADAVVTPDGYLLVDADVDPASSVLDVTDGIGGTVVQWAGDTSRDGAATLVVARGQAADGGQVQGVAYDVDPHSALRYGGPFNPLPVPHFYFSPLLTNAGQCRAAALTVLRRLRRGASRTVTAEMVPHPGLEAGDRVTVTGAGLDGAGAVVEGMRVPLTPGDGAMTLTLRVM